MPPPALGTQSLGGLTTVDLPGSSLMQWATHIQDVASGMRMPPEVAVNCPQEDIVGVLNWLERMTLVKYCRLCFGVGKKCGYSSVPRQTPSQASALWTPLMMSYAAMTSSTKTTASSSVGGVPPSSYPPPGLPPLEPAPMDMLLAPTSENLLATAGVGRGGRGLRQPRTPTAPGLRQMRPMAPPQWMPTPGRQEASQATPYWQQVYPPRHTTGVRTATTQVSTAPSTSQGCGEMARGSKGARGRSSSGGPQGQNRRDRSSTRGSRKCRRGIYSDNPMDDVSNYVALGWKRDLTHIIGCYWVAQVGPLDSEEWEVVIRKFLKAMRNRRASEWMDIKELSPLKFMPYMAELFKNVTGRDLKGLGDFTGWVGLGGYYHWKLSQLGQLHACPCLQGQQVPDGPVAQPSGRPHPRRSAQTGTPAAGTSGRHQDGGQPTSDRGGKTPTSNRGGKPASAGRGGKQAASGGLADLPSEREGAGDGPNWYERSIWGAEGETSKPQGPPYPIGTAQARREATSQIYNRVASKDPPPCNVASEAIRAYYPGIEPRTLKTWACQVLCMISEYHMACVTRRSPVTSPILPGVIEDKLPPLTDYALPEDRSGVTDVRVQDHQARTLRVAVWLHRLDMALSEEPAASGSLVRARHSLGHLLAYFLAPGTTWGLQFEDVVDQVLRENRKHNERKCNELTSSLQKCHSRRTKLRDEFDAVSKTMEVITDGRSHREMEQRLNALQTSLNAVETSITKFENLLKDGRMVEKVHCIEEDEARQEEKEETADIEMVDKEEHGNPESSGPHMEADTEDIPPLVSGGDTISPEEEAILLQETPQSEDPATGSHSPRSETATVSGEMAVLCLTSPNHPGPRRMTPHHRSLPFSVIA